MLTVSTRKHTLRRTKKEKKKSCQLYFALVVPSYDGNAVVVLAAAAAVAPVADAVRTFHGGTVTERAQRLWW